MKSILAKVLVLSVLVALVVAVQAADDKEVTLKGTILCAKCELKETAKCTNAIRVKNKDDGKETVYYFKDMNGKEKYHATICSSPKEGEVKGVVEVIDGKKWITPVKDSVKFTAKD
jgi:hypothetical protein